MLNKVNIHNARVDEDFGFQNRIYNYCCPLKIEMCAIMCPQCP